MSATVSENNTRVTFTISKDLKERAATVANNEHRSLSNLLSVALEYYIKQHN